MTIIAVCVLGLFAAYAPGCQGGSDTAANHPYAGMTFSPNPNATPAPTDTPDESPTETPPKPVHIDHHDERQAIREWWNGVIVPFAISEAAFEYARTYVANGDLVSASQLMEQSAKYASSASQMAREPAPSGLDDAQQKLTESAQDFSDAQRLLRSYLDDQKPSVAADSLAKNNAADALLSDATHLVRVRFRDLGGDPMAISDIDKNTAGVKEIMNALLGAGL